MVITDKWVKYLTETFSFQFQYDFIKHNLIELICLYSLSDKTWETVDLFFFIIESLFLKHDIDLGLKNDLLWFHLAFVINILKVF